MVTGLCYAKLLGQIDTEAVHLARREVLIHYNNTAAFNFNVALTILRELGYELVPHQPYSSDLALSDVVIFQT